MVPDADPLPACIGYGLEPELVTVKDTAPAVGVAEGVLVIETVGVGDNDAPGDKGGDVDMDSVIDGVKLGGIVIDGVKDGVIVGVKLGVLVILGVIVMLGVLVGVGLGNVNCWATSHPYACVSIKTEDEGILSSNDIIKPACNWAKETLDE